MDLKQAYKTIMDDHFPDSMTIRFGDQTLEYRKRAWKLEDGGAVVEKGLRYGENPGQEAAMESPMTPTPQPESRMEEAEQIVSSWAISFNSSLVPVSMS
mgnify:CR=1 FL=1